MTAYALENHGEIIGVRRYNEGTYQDGVYHEGEPQTITILAVVLPASPEEISIISAGMETNAAIQIYSSEPLKTGSKSGKGRNPDIIEYDDRIWQVHNVRRYKKATGETVYISVAVLKDD